jgi:predicted small metal-binding protein
MRACRRVTSIHELPIRGLLENTVALTVLFFGAINQGSIRALAYWGKLNKGVEMRALDCECGQHLEASNNEELFEKAREHVDRDHPEMELDDSQVRDIVAQGAYDK